MRDTAILTFMLQDIIQEMGLTEDTVKEKFQVDSLSDLYSQHIINFNDDVDTVIEKLGG